MPYDIHQLLLETSTRCCWEADDLAEEAAWTVIERCGWPATPLLLFALKQQILEQMAGG
ncbi:MAG TPA: hypothetical protein VIY48_19995 [Candidatus Paceibacterota bacterium]